MDISHQSSTWVYLDGHLQRFSAGKPDATLAEIASFAELPAGWHYGEGGPIPQKTIDLARTLVGDMRSVGLLEIDAFAGCNGEISLIAGRGAYDVEAIVENDGAVSVAYDVDDKQVSYKTHLEYRLAILAIKEISAVMGKAWSTSGYFIHETIISRNSDSPISPSVIWEGGHLWREAFLWSTMIAWKKLAKAFPPTSEPTTAILPWSRLFSGNSYLPSSPRPVAQSASLPAKAIHAI